VHDRGGGVDARAGPTTATLEEAPTDRALVATQGNTAQENTEDGR
jgi:hypothetical protein